MKKIVTVIAAAAMCALVYYCVQYIQSPVSTMAARGVTHEEVINGDAYIVRNETVYTAPGGGTFYSYAREGARVGRNRRLCAVFSGVVSEEILQELNTVDAKIAELSSVVVDNSAFMSDSGSTAERLLQLQSEIEKAAADNDIAAIAKYKAEIESLAAGGSVKTNAQQLTELAEQKSGIESKITSPKDEIYSSVSGIYSAKVDGFENVLTPDAAKNITVEAFGQIKAEEVVVPAVETKEEKKEKAQTEAKTVAAGDKICKVIDNHEWYIMALVERADIEGMKTGQKVELRFGKLPGEQVEAEVAAISNDPPEQKKAVLVLLCKSYSEGAFSIRASDIEIIKESYQGFSVPIHAVRVVDGQNGVMVRNGGKEVFKPCRIIYKDDKSGEAIIKPDTEDINKTLQQYDIIVIGEK